EIDAGVVSFDHEGLSHIVGDLVAKSDPGSKRKFANLYPGFAKSAVFHIRAYACTCLEEFHHRGTQRADRSQLPTSDRDLGCAGNRAQHTIVYHSRMSGTPQKSEQFVVVQPVPEARAWAERVATRLWMLQTSFADDPPATRHDYLVEEIERSLKEVSPSRRSEYLSALMERFPGPERIDAPYFRPPQVEHVQKSAQEIADELVARLGELSSEGKAVLAQKLQTLGLFVAPTTGFELPAELLGKVGISPKDALDEERL